MKRSLFVVALLSLSTFTAGATIIGGTVTGGTAMGAGGTFIKLTPPLSNPLGPADSVGNDTFQTPNLYGFDEDQNIHLVAPLVTDAGTNPIPAGTTVASHYIFFDPGPSLDIVGTVDFDSDIIAIITGTANLANSDFLANTGVNYLNPALRGLEAGDSVTISGTRQILFNTTASSPGDYVRVLTEFSPTATPEPATISLFGLGFATLGLLRIRRSKNSS
ncbi:MAG TPA: PEP-CTERM sorting domain-containing protein [Bryobacteraceae bacterium]|nr:PEP-CTERM sorting domain-containing protein [Bryobacteraceae bacterium]